MDSTLRSAVSVSFVLPVMLLLATPRAGAVDFMRGDFNADGRLSITDAAGAVMFLFGGPEPPCLDAADADDNGRWDIRDGVVIILKLFSGDQEIPPPFPGIGPDPTEDDIDCRSYELSPPPVTDDTLRLAEVEALPGELVAVPLLSRSDALLNAFQIVVRYDSRVFTPIDPRGDVQLVERSLQGGALGLSAPDIRIGFLGLLDFPGEGLFRLGFMPSFIQPIAFAPGSEQVVVNVLGRIAPDVEPGTFVRLELAEQQTEFGPLECEVTDSGEPRLPGTLLSGGIHVAPPVRFVRGDSNIDGSIDVSDAIHMLQFMFLGGAVLECRDAADVNDNGVNEISDSVGLLAYLFLGGLPPQDPWPDCGVDEGDEEIDCEGYPFCE